MFERDRRQRRRRGGPDCGDCADCFSCPLLLFIPWLFLTKVLPGALRPSALDPHTHPHTGGSRIASRLIRSYQLNVSVPRGRSVCRMTPSCSRYGLQAVSSYGALKGGWLIAGRLRRCGSGAACTDPVPPR